MRTTTPGIMSRPQPGSQINWGHPLANGLEALWLFNDMAGNRVNDSHPNAHHLTFSGTRQYWGGRPGGSAQPVGVSMPITGTGQMRNTNTRPQLRALPTLSLEFWYQASTATAINGYFWIMAASSGSAPKFRIIKNSSTATIYAQFYLSTGNIDGQTVRVAIDSKLHHFAATYDRNTFCVYLDGRLEATTAGTGLDSVNQGVELHFGAYPSASVTCDVTYYKASMYGRGLTAQEVGWLYANPYDMLLPAPRRWSYDTVTAGPSAVRQRRTLDPRAGARGVPWF